VNDLEIETTVGHLLLKKGFTVAVAESCTGGLIAFRITSVGGSSAWFRGGIIAYSNDVKIKSWASAAPRWRDMARSSYGRPADGRGVRRRLGTDFGIAVTGIAGPAAEQKRSPSGSFSLDWLMEIVVRFGGSGSVGTGPPSGNRAARRRWRC